MHSRCLGKTRSSKKTTGDEQRRKSFPHEDSFPLVSITQVVQENQTYLIGYEQRLNARADDKDQERLIKFGENSHKQLLDDHKKQVRRSLERGRMKRLQIVRNQKS